MAYFSVTVNGFVINQYPASEHGAVLAATLKHELSRVLVNYPSLSPDVSIEQGGFIEVGIEQVMHRVGTIMSAEWYEALTSPEDGIGNSRDNRSDNKFYNAIPGRRTTTPDSTEKKRRKS